VSFLLSEIGSCYPAGDGRGSFFACRDRELTIMGTFPSTFSRRTVFSLAGGGGDRDSISGESVSGDSSL